MVCLYFLLSVFLPCLSFSRTFHALCTKGLVTLKPDSICAWKHKHSGLYIHRQSTSLFMGSPRMPEPTYSVFSFFFPPSPHPRLKPLSTRYTCSLTSHRPTSWRSSTSRLRNRTRHKTTRAVFISRIVHKLGFCISDLLFFFLYRHAFCLNKNIPSSKLAVSILSDTRPLSPVKRRRAR